MAARVLLGCVVLALIAFPAPALASGDVSVVVDAKHPQCSDQGYGTPDRPFCTIDGALRRRGGPGEVIEVRAGTYREQVVVPAQRRLSSLILRAKGRVIIECSDTFADSSLWVRFTGDIWLARSVGWRPRQIFADGVRLTVAETDTANLPARSFKYVPGHGLYVRVGGHPGAQTLLVGHRSSGFTVSGGSGVSIEGFTVRRADEHGIEIESAEQVAVRRDTVELSFSNGIEAEDSRAVTIDSCRASENANHGIVLLRTRDSRLSHNVATSNQRLAARAANGIHLRDSPSNLLFANRTHHNQDSGIHIQGESTNNRLVRNLSWLNGDHGFDLLRISGVSVIGSVAWGNAHDGISVEGGTSNARVYNTISQENGETASHYDLYVDSLSTSGFVSNDNLFWNRTTQRPIRYARTSYSTIAAFNTATGHDSRSVQADARFTDPVGGDFRLDAGSPAIDRADAGAAGWSLLDAAGCTPADDPDATNLGRGQPSYADLGALERDGVAPSPPAPPPVRAVKVQTASPNPTDGRTEMIVTLPSAGQVQMRVLDVTGREVWSTTRDLPAGNSVLRWFGTDQDGERVPAGVYYVLLVDGTSRATRRIVMLR